MSFNPAHWRFVVAETEVAAVTLLAPLGSRSLRIDPGCTICDCPITPPDEPPTYPTACAVNTMKPTSNGQLLSIKSHGTTTARQSAPRASTMDAPLVVDASTTALTSAPAPPAAGFTISTARFFPMIKGSRFTLRITG